MYIDFTGVATVVAAALLLGILMARLRQAPLVGYIVTGVLLGPTGVGLIADRQPIGAVAELGVIVLLFLVGMRLDLGDFRAAYRTAVFGTALQIGVSVAALVALAPVVGWPLPLAVFLGFVISLSSTAVGVRMLEDIGELDSPPGRCVVAILIAQDLAFVPILIVVNGMAGEAGLQLGTLLALAAAVAALALALWHLGRRAGDLALPFGQWVRRHRDLAALAALAYCFAGAAASGALGLSPAFGAFLAGLYVGNTGDRGVLTEAALPIESVLVMVFFLSIGLLIDLRFVWAELGAILLLLACVLVANSVINVLVLRAVGEPWQDAVIAGFALAQIGEFSFILTGVGLGAGLLNEQGSRLVISVIALTLVISPLWLNLARRLSRLSFAVARPSLAEVAGGLARSEAAAVWAGWRRAARRGASALQGAARRGRRAVAGVLSGRGASPRPRGGDGAGRNEEPTRRR